MGGGNKSGKGGVIVKEGFYKKGPFQEIAGYRFRKSIFRYAVMLMVLLLFFAWADADFSLERRLYFECPLDAQGGLCENPFYKMCIYEPLTCPFAVDYPELPPAFEDISDQATLPAGFKVGEPAPFFVKNFGTFIGILIVLAFVVNHFLYNSGYDFKSKGKKLKEALNEVE